MVECLENLIGIRGYNCGADTVPDSVYYINDLAGIGIKEADAAMDSEVKNGYELLLQKINIAGDLIANNMRTYFNPRYKGGSIIGQHTIGKWRNDRSTSAAAATYLIGKNFYMTNSPYLEFNIGKVGLMVDYTGDVDVFVYDIIANKLLDTITVACVAGVPSYVDTSKVYKTWGQKLNLFIGYAADFASYKTNMTSGDCITCRGYGYSNPYINVDSAKVLIADDKIEANLDPNSNNDGLSITYSINCTFEPFICTNKILLAEAIWYKAGALVAEEMKFSKRFNSVVTLYKTDATELITNYEAKSMMALNTVLQNMRLPDNVCFDCNKKVKLSLGLP